MGWTLAADARLFSIAKRSHPIAVILQLVDTEMGERAAIYGRRGWQTAEGFVLT
jgi:hypothetical protein